MSATELIRQVAALPPHEKARFIELIHALENSTASPVPARLVEENGRKVLVAPPDFAQRLHRIYGDAVAPDSQCIIDEGRGDR